MQQNHFLLEKKSKNTESAQLWIYYLLVCWPDKNLNFGEIK